jgi:hypothetical protein
LGRGDFFNAERNTKGAKGQKFARSGLQIQAESAELPNPAGVTLVLVEAGKYNNEIQDLSNSVNPPDWLLCSGERKEKNK